VSNLLPDYSGRQYYHVSRVRVTIRRGLDWMIEFIDPLYTVFGTARNYSAIADLQTLQLTITHIRVLNLH
jgi:hypothetical protein